MDSLWQAIQFFDHYSEAFQQEKAILMSIKYPLFSF